MSLYLIPTSISKLTIKGSLQDFTVLFLTFAETSTEVGNQYVEPSYDGVNRGLLSGYEFSALGYNTVSPIGVTSNLLVVTNPNDSSEYATIKRSYEGAETLGVYYKNATNGLLNVSFRGASFYYIAGLALCEFSDGVHSIATFAMECPPDNPPAYITLDPPTDADLGYCLVSRGSSGYARIRSMIGFTASNSMVALAEVFFASAKPETPPDTDPYAGIDGEEEIPDGGPVAIPGLPPITAASTGIIGLFAPSISEMAQLADYMWTDFGGTGTDITEVLKEIVEALKRSISNPLDYVIGLNIIPSQGLSIGSPSVIKFGFTSSGVSMPRLSNQYFTVDCGTINFPPLCGDTFLDYAPYAKFSIYLPYIGVKDVDANDFVGHTIGVIYHGDTVTGGVTAYITKDGSVMYQYSGCCALNIPLSADNWGNTIAGAVQIATSMVAGGVVAGAAGVGMAAAKGAASVAANPSLLSPQVSHSGAVSGGAGCMAVQYPFVIREAVRFHSTAGFNKFSGYPSYYMRSLAEISGFTTVLDAHLENIPATNGEIAEIETLLKNGVIL